MPGCQALRIDMTRLGFFFFWLLHFLPHRALIALGRTLGALLFHLARERRQITLTNLRLCFPEQTEAQRKTIAREHFALYGQTLIERTLLYWASPERLMQMIRLEGEENLIAQAGKPVILFAFHFVGMEVTWLRLTMKHSFAAFYARMSNPDVEARLMARRNRFREAVMVSNKEGIKSALDVVRSGIPLIYLPDMDFGRKHSIFVPFFAAQAATIPGLSRMAAQTGAVVLPVIPHLTPSGWVVSVEPAWSDFPTDDIHADTRRMNAHIERWVSRYPAQYWWTHKRFKTRPPGEKPVY
jgi:Kdo2-lipid IVA lauroyltransferase/acyltransferase